MTYKKMFGEYMVYAHEKPVMIVCDNCVMVKKLPELAGEMADAPCGLPYEGGKEHYILDIENAELVARVLPILEANTPLPKKRARRGTAQ